VRCRGCGAEFADDVRGCPACGDAGESLPVVDLDDDELGIRTEDRYAYVPPGPKWIRRRVHDESSRIPIVILAGLLLVFLVGAWLQQGSGDRAAPRPEVDASALPTLRQPTGASLLVLTPDGLHTLDVDSHQVRKDRVAELPVGPVTAATTTGDHAVLVVDHRAYAVPLSLDRPAAGIGPAVEAFPAKRAGRVWLLTYPRDGTVAAREVGLDGAETTPAAVLDGGATVRAAAGEGLVIERLSPDGARALGTWDPAVPSNAPTTFRTNAIFVAASRDVVASRDAACGARRCDLYLEDLATGGERVVANAVGRGGVAAAEFSPGGRRLAIIESEGERLRGTFVNTMTGALVPFEVGPVASSHPSIAWSRDGRWLFVSTSTGRIEAFSRRGYVIPTRRLDSAALIAR
jgi:hypothetical protein